MRKSVMKYDPCYDPNAINYCVFLDGNKLENCHTADEELRVAYCHDIDPRDSLGRKISFKFLDAIPQIVKRGRVEIRPCKTS